MRNSLRILLGVSALAFLVTAAPVLAAEVDVSGENVDTGFDSENENEFDVDQDIDVDVDNDGDVDNKVDVDANTGYNDQNKNTNAGDLETGEVDATADWESVVNDGAGLCGCDLGDGLDVTADFLNDTTGAESENENELDVDHDVDIDIDNWADIYNKLDFDANTGYNDQNKNTNAGDLSTGNASLETFLSNWANSGSGLDGANGDGNGVSVDVTAENNTTGFDSENENEVDVDSDFDLDVDNDADIDNKIDVDLNTGYNDQNKNTNAGSLTTGDANALVDIVNVANSSGCCLLNSGGSLSVEADLVNDTTGAESENENEVDVDHDVDIDVDNDADIDNKVDVDANTGYNDQNKNTNAGSTETGDVNIELVITNEVNS